jgi:hypothetical protein
MEPSLERPGREWDGADPHHPRALAPGAGTEGPSRGKTLSPPRHEGKWCPSVVSGSPWSRGWALGGRKPPTGQGRGGEMSGDEKPEPFKRKGMITVKPRQESQKTERRKDIKRRINEELEIYEKCYQFFKRTSSKIIRDYTAEQILRRAADLRGEK